jgi:hypothetical protein
MITVKALTFCRKSRILGVKDEFAPATKVCNPHDDRQVVEARNQETNLNVLERASISVPWKFPIFWASGSGHFPVIVTPHHPNRGYADDAK